MRDANFRFMKFLNTFKGKKREIRMKKLETGKSLAFI